jgi:hypothetical protein
MGSRIRLGVNAKPSSKDLNSAPDERIKFRAWKQC